MTWEGSEELRPFLVPIAELEPFPGNPRRGNVEAIRASIRRFGQLKPIVIDGQRILAGNHFTLAAAEEDWTHVAAVSAGLADEHEGQAFQIADNRTHDLGPGYDERELLVQLEALAELDRLEGTGYDLEDVDALEERLQRLHQLEEAQPARPPEPLPPADVAELVLVYPRERLEQLRVWLQIVAHERSTAGDSDTVFEGLRVAALQLNAK